MKYKIIINPITRKVKEKLAVVEKVLIENGKDYDKYFTQGVGDAEIASRAFAKDGRRDFIVIGGDGTVSEVMNALFENDKIMDENITLGLIPTGSANDFALDLGIPLDARKAAIRILRGKSRIIDLIQVEYNGSKRLFHVDSGLGLTTEALEIIHEQSRKIPGTLMYIGLALQTLFGYKNKPVNYVIDGKEMSINTTLLIVSNGLYFLALNFRPDSRMDDGLFEVTILHDMNWLDIIFAIIDLIRGRILKNRKILSMKARELIVRPQEKLGMNIDGDLKGHTPARFSVKPNALKISV